VQMIRSNGFINISRANWEVPLFLLVTSAGFFPEVESPFPNHGLRSLERGSRAMLGVLFIFNILVTSGQDQVQEVLW
jgi:hypothetical protein